MIPKLNIFYLCCASIAYLFSSECEIRYLVIHIGSTRSIYLDKNVVLYFGIFGCFKINAKEAAKSSETTACHVRGKAVRMAERRSTRKGPYDHLQVSNTCTSMNMRQRSRSHMLGVLRI